MRVWQTNAATTSIVSIVRHVVLRLYTTDVSTLRN